MKRLLTILLCTLLLALPLLPAAQAAVAYFDYEVTETLEDGSSLVTSIQMEEQLESDTFDLLSLVRAFLQRLLRFFGKTDTVTKTKYLRYYDSKGVLLWTTYLTATFQYNGKKVVCTEAALTAEIADGDWTLDEKQTEKADNTAKGTVTFRQHKLGVPLKTITRTLTLTCDNNGNVK